MDIPKVAWCIPVNRDIDPRIYQNHLGALSYTLSNGIAKIEHFIMPVNKVIDKARNITALAALKAGADYLFWVDQDVKIWPHAIELLLAHEKQIIGGLYFIKGYPYHPCLFQLNADSLSTGKYDYMDNYVAGLNKVGLTGFGCMLISASVFKNLPYPWFRLIKANTTEDVFFCQQATIHGYEIWVDSEIKCRHLGERTEIGEREFLFAQRKENFRNEVECNS